jgi:BASS family bile acid:Na+ symporter
VTPLIPEWFVSGFAVATVFVVMFHLGLGILPREFLWVWRQPVLMLRALFAVLVAVPLIALFVARALELPRPAEVGLVLMAIAPGAPIALQRSLGAGASRAFAPGLQVTVALLAVVSMPLSIAALDVLYGANAAASPWQIMRQVTVVQLLPLALGVATARLLPRAAALVEPWVGRIWKLLLVTLVAMAVVGFWGMMVAAGLTVAFAAALTTLGALAVGHWLGGPEPGTRTAVAITCAARNPGLALLVAALNDAPVGVKATLLTYMVVAAFTALPYALERGWRGRSPPQDLRTER